jgi:hypothetical protein
MLRLHGKTPHDALKRADGLLQTIGQIEPIEHYDYKLAVAVKNQ